MIKYNIYTLDEFDNIYIADIISNNIKYFSLKEDALCYIDNNSEVYIKVPGKNIEIDSIKKIFSKYKFKKYRVINLFIDKDLVKKNIII